MSAVCRHGHPLPAGSTQCLVCHRAQQAVYRQRQKAGVRIYRRYVADEEREAAFADPSAPTPEEVYARQAALRELLNDVRRERHARNASTPCVHYGLRTA